MGQKRTSGNSVCASGHTLQVKRGFDPLTMSSGDGLPIDIWASACGSIPSVCAGHTRDETAASASRVTRRGIGDCENCSARVSNCLRSTVSLSAQCFAGAPRGRREESRSGAALKRLSAGRSDVPVTIHRREARQKVSGGYIKN